MFARTPHLLLRPFWPDDEPAIAGRPIPRDLLILLRGEEPPRLIGGLAFPREGRAGGLDCWIDPEWRGRGLATEAARAVVAMASESLRLEQLVTAVPSAPAGVRMLTRLGFRPAPGNRLVLDLAPLPLAA